MDTATRHERTNATTPLLEIIIIFAVTICFAAMTGHAAYLRVAAGMGALALVGTVIVHALHLRLMANFAYLVTLGQIVLLLYVYLRSAISKIIPQATLLSFELRAVVALLAIWWLSKRPWRQMRRRTHMRHWLLAAPVILAIVPLCIVLEPKLTLLCLPSSDPIVQAYLTKQMLAAGTLLTGNYSGSDVLINYPTGFVALCSMWSLLTGLDATQMTGVTPYLQYMLWAYLAWGSLSTFALPRGVRWLVACIALAVLPYAFNPLLLHEREYLEGTGRLAHSVMLLFPIIFLFVNRQHRQRARPFAVWLILASCIAFGACINPAHAAFSGFAVLAAALYLRHRRMNLLPDMGRACIALGLVLGLLWSQDAYYRASLIDPLWHGGSKLQQASGLGARNDIDKGYFWVPDGFMQTLESKETLLKLEQFWTFRGLDGDSQKAAHLLVLLTAAVGIAIWVGSRRLTPQAAWTARLLYLGTMLGLAQIFYTNLVTSLVSPKYFPAALMYHYTQRAHYQVLALLYPLLLCVPLTVLGLSRARMRANLWKPALAVTSLALLLPIDWQRDAFYARAQTAAAALHQCALGSVTSDDVALARWAQKHVPKSERVLLSGNIMETAAERWLFPHAAANAFGLHADVSTAFFFGADGQDTGPVSYQERVQRFDPVWLEKHKILWAIKSDLLPENVMGKYYELKHTEGRAMLYRLKTRTDGGA